MIESTMKLVIQIPCLDEEESLPQTLAALPRQIRGIDEIEVIVVDDGSTDRTAEVALAHGVAEVVRFPNHQGLARAFAAGLDHALQRGADVVVNTDADNQYDARDIEALVQPILRGEADMVIGDRDASRLEHFSATKRVLQGLGSWAVRQLSGTAIPDATSGFRAVSRAAALKLNVLSDFTYTLETIIQAGKKQIAVAHVPVRARPTERPSRLFSGTSHYVRRSAATLLRMYAFYEPFKFFFLIGGVLILSASAIGVRFIIEYFRDGGAGHIQSLILAGALLVTGAVTWLFGVLADLIGRNRQLTEEVLLRMRRIELTMGRRPETRPETPPSDDAAAPRRWADRRPR
jgi:glycosyltransferase involved in cell wall biosynthesis